jgi:hypothetical protein
MFASAKTGRTLRVARDRVLSTLPDTVVRTDYRAHPAGRGVEFIPDANGTHTVRLHRMDRESNRGPNPPEFRGVVRVDFNGATAVQPDDCLLITRGSFAVYHERNVQAAVGQPDGTTADASRVFARQ